MKKATKIWLIVAAALVFIGIVAFVLIMTINHWRFTALNTTQYETNTVNISESFQNISINSDTGDIAFIQSDDGKCRVDFYETENERHTAKVQNGTLLIEKINTGNWIDHVSIFSIGAPKITVYLPQEKYAALLIDEGTGDVTIPGEFSFENIEISASTGDVSCYASSTGMLHINTSTGSIHTENLSAEALDLSVTTGRIEIRSVTCAGAIGANVSTGKTFINDTSCKSFTSSGSTGDINMANFKATEMLSIERSTGDVKFDHCDAGELLITTDTGDVTGSLLSDKVFIVKTDTGDIEVPETTTGGKCQITTDTGDIKIQID